jgi:hypothetical protein
VVQCDQTSPFADSMMLSSEEVRRPLQRPVSFLLTSEVQHVNHIDRSFGAVFARWRGLGILSLPRLGRTRDAHLTHLDGVHEGSGLGDRPRTLFEFFQPHVGPSEVLSSLGFSGKPQISWTRMHILHEVKQLYSVSDRLDSLAEQHPLVSEALPRDVNIPLNNGYIR